MTQLDRIERDLTKLVDPEVGIHAALAAHVAADRLTHRTLYIVLVVLAALGTASPSIGKALAGVLGLG